MGESKLDITGLFD